MKHCAVLWLSCLFFVSALQAAPPPREGGEEPESSVVPDSKTNESDKAHEQAAGHATKFALDVKIVGGEPEAPIRDADVSLKGADGVELCDPKRPDTKGLVHFRDIARADIRVVVVSTNWKTLKQPYRLEKPHETLKVTLKPLD